MHVMVSGLPGSGKGLWTQYLIHQELVRNGPRWVDKERNRNAFKGCIKENRVVKYADIPDEIYSSIPVVGHLAPNVVVSDAAKMMETRMPGVYYIDEMQDFFPARGFKDFSKDAVKWWTQHRKFDAFIVSNTQHPEFVDKITQILTDEVHTPQLYRIPLLGWLVPRSVRPPQLARGGLHYRRDARGDRVRWYYRVFGVGTLLRVSVWPPSVLGGEKDLTPKELERRAASRRVRQIWKFFDIEYAQRYESGAI